MPPKAIRRKGLSEEEKLERVLAYFHETLQPHTMKDLIKDVPKAKGVPFNVVEGLVKMLVGDNLVLQDKVGVSNLLWSFPATSDTVRVANLEKLNQDIDALEAQRATLEATLAELSTTRCAPTRPALLEELRVSTEQHTVLASELASLQTGTASSVAALAAETRCAMQQAEDMNTKMLTLTTHISKARGIPQSEILTELGL